MPSSFWGAGRGGQRREENSGFQTLSPRPYFLSASLLLKPWGPERETESVQWLLGSAGAEG